MLTVKLLNLLRKDYGRQLPLIAEDLGVITEGVERLRDYFELPGMKILQFAFDGNKDNPYLPENITNYKSIVYSLLVTVLRFTVYSFPPYIICSLNGLWLL